MKPQHEHRQQAITNLQPQTSGYRSEQSERKNLRPLHTDGRYTFRDDGDTNSEFISPSLNNLKNSIFVSSCRQHQRW